MKVIRPLLLNLAVALTIFGPCRTAFASKSANGADESNGSGTTAGPDRDVRRDSASKEGKKKESRRTDHFRIGVLGGLGFPRPLSLEGMVKIERIVGLGAEYSVLPSISISS